MRTIQLTIAYDGAAYAGWQVQAEQPTIQAAIESAVHKITGTPTRVIASGRTDSGVHALGQVASFDTESRLTAGQLQRALNAELPHDIAVLRAVDARPGFHAIRDCIGKRYRYVLHDGPTRDVFHRHHSWHVRQRLDVGVMRQAAGPLVGTHDFRSFETQWPNRDSSVRTVREIAIERRTDHPSLIDFEIEADGFLYNMVRAIVGTLVEVGRGARSIDWPTAVLAAQDRSQAGATAPAQGLFLLRVDYPPDVLLLVSDHAAAETTRGE